MYLLVAVLPGSLSTPVILSPFKAQISLVGAELFHPIGLIRPEIEKHQHLVLIIKSILSR